MAVKAEAGAPPLFGCHLMNKDWQACGIKTTNLVDLNGGGDLGKMQQALFAVIRTPAK